MAEPSGSISFPLPCAACTAVAAFPFIASTVIGVGDRIRLGMRCRECRHEWFVQLRTAADGLHELKIED